MTARIYRPAKTATQSGRAKTKKWRLEFDTAGARFIEPLMGWTGSSDTRGQIHMGFDTMEAAVAFAETHGIAYEIEMPATSRTPRRAYADNFRYDRRH